MNLLKEKLQSGRTVYGTHVSLSDPALCDILGRVGFDYLWIDMEHTTLSCEQVQVHMLIAQSRGAAAVVRIPPDDLVTLKRLLEMGPDGIIFPMVGSAKHAGELIGHTLYPPLGTRGFGPRGAVDYGMADTNKYIERGSLELCRFVQIEARGAYEELDGILAIPWLDGVIVGPCDLAGQYGSLTDIMAPPMLERIGDIARRGRAAGKTVGLSIGADDLDTLQKWFSLGISMLSAGADTTSLWTCASQTLQTLKEASKSAC